MNLRNLAIWGVVVVVALGLYSMVAGGSRTAGVSEISYSQLLNKVGNGDVKKAEIAGSRVEITDGGGKIFATTTPNNQDELVIGG
ncbi:MAG TPA: ATP-dependent metallopeptidase FtsH/Yme1/Tma family protein, partial [Phenylobacterium sp.]|nr:ATP-dependent metallopeptidase FtsH/Yme1/Tma family protein [Phenylobacterium sp.]